LSFLVITSGPDVQTKTIKTGAFIIFLSSPPRFGSLEPEHRRRKTLKIVVLEKQQEKVESKVRIFSMYTAKRKSTYLQIHGTKINVLNITVL
jgi:hypothetical protein